MKVSVHAYAQALLDLTRDASSKEISAIIEKFLSELAARHALGSINKIIAEYERLSDEADGIVRATITSARKLSKTVLEEASSLVKKKTRAKEVKWTELVEPSLLGGVRIAAGDMIIDMSLAHRVAELGSRIKE